MKTYVACYNTQMGIQNKSADFSSSLSKLDLSLNSVYKANALKNKKSYFEANKEAAQVIKNLYNPSKKTICFTEDHSLVAGIFSNLPKNSGLVYVDAHTDIHSWETSASKNPHGMSLGTFMGLEGKEFVGNVAPNNLIMLGIKDYEKEEIENLKKLQIKHVFGYDKENRLFYNIFSAEQKSFEEIVELINHVAKNTSSMGLSFDLDVLDKNEFSGAHYNVGNMPVNVCKKLFDKTSNLFSLIEVTELDTHNTNENDFAIFKNIIKSL